MPSQRENLEQKALERFEKVALQHGYHVFKGQGTDNRILVGKNIYFQFGDLRVETRTRHVVIEAESAGGVTNLVKYWYCLERQLIDKPLILLHLFRQTSQADYGSHLALWDFLQSQMINSLGEKIKAVRYTYREITELKPALDEFEKYLKQP